MSYNFLKEQLGWPDRRTIFDPPGEGVKVNHQFIKEKLLYLF